jgi:hypothetical protein
MIQRQCQSLAAAANWAASIHSDEGIASQLSGPCPGLYRPMLHAESMRQQNETLTSAYITSSVRRFCVGILAEAAGNKARRMERSGRGNKIAGRRCRGGLRHFNPASAERI